MGRQPTSSIDALIGDRQHPPTIPQLGDGRHRWTIEPVEDKFGVKEGELR
jgi:hypothetical protein